MACEMLEEAARVGNPSVQELCLDTIFRHPQDALKSACLLSTERFNEVLSSTKLCISDFDLATVILGWAQFDTSVAKARHFDIPALLERHVQLAALSEETYAKLRSLAEAAG